MAPVAARAREVARTALHAFPPAASAYNLIRAERSARHLMRSMHEARPLISVQMGRVGSAKVVETLEPAGIPSPVAHVHFLEVIYVREVRRQQIRDVGRTRVGYTWALGRAIGSRFVKLGDDLEVDAITLVRDPIAWAVSAVFQSPHLARATHTALATRDDRRLDVKQTVAWLASSIETLGSADYPERGFEREFEPVLGVDVFDPPFDFDRGYRIIDGPLGRMLVLRTKDLDRRRGPALEAFCPLAEPPKRCRSNVRLDEGSRSDYQDVLEPFRLPAPLAEKIYAGRFAQHSYSPTESDSLQQHLHARTS